MMGRKTKWENMEHTKGPWIVSSGTIVCDKSARIVSQGVCFDGLGVPIKEATSNARLISAAPDLLEALQFIVDDAPEGEDARLTVDGYNKACAAIAKAEGR